MDTPCPTCMAGLLRPLQTTYLRVIGSTLLHLPHADAARCDICGTVYFDPDQVRLLDLLVGEAGPPPNHHPAPPPAPRATRAVRAEGSESTERADSPAPSHKARRPKSRNG